MPDHHLKLVLKSTSGSVTEEFARDAHAKHVLEVAIKKIPLAKNPPQPYVMRDERTGTVLDPSEKLVSLGVESGDTIIIQAGTPVDG